MTRSEIRRGGADAPVAVVTGASAGIGRATAVALARRGWRVALLARGHAGLDGARREIEAAGSDAFVIPVDVANADAVSDAAERVVGTWGRIDIWINNAMATVFGPADLVRADEWQRVTAVTYLGAVNGTLAALRHMRTRNSGVIVQIGSALAYRSIPLQAPYCAAKAALRGFTDSLRCELVHDGSRVRLTMVQLPGVNTPQFGWSRTHMGRRHRPVGPVFQPEPIAEAIIEAALHTPRELWVGIPTAQAILGTMAAPGLLDRYLARAAYGPQLASDLAGDGDILFTPSNDDRGVHGRFDDEAAMHVVRASSAAVRGGIAIVAAAVVSGLLLLLRNGRRRQCGPQPAKPR